MRVISGSVNGTIRLAEALSRKLEKGDIVCLFGELGSGKTVFAKGIARGLGLQKNQIISPTFVLLREYNTKRFPLYHFDFYRLRSPRDILDLGYQEFFYGQGVSVVEWADRLGCLLPEEFLGIKIQVGPKSKRLFKITAKGRRYQKLLGEFNENFEH